MIYSFHLNMKVSPLLIIFTNYHQMNRYSDEKLKQRKFEDTKNSKP